VQSLKFTYCKIGVWNKTVLSPSKLTVFSKKWGTTEKVLADINQRNLSVPDYIIFQLAPVTPD
jgi:hypothetical protein